MIRPTIVSLSHHIFCTHHPSGFPLARPTSFSFVPALSFCLGLPKMAENSANTCYTFQTLPEIKWRTPRVPTAIATHSGSLTVHSGID